MKKVSCVLLAISLAIGSTSAVASSQEVVLASKSSTTSLGIDSWTIDVTDGNRQSLNVSANKSERTMGRLQVELTRVSFNATASTDGTHASVSMGESSKGVFTFSATASDGESARLNIDLRTGNATEVTVKRDSKSGRMLTTVSKSNKLEEMQLRGFFKSDVFRSAQRDVYTTATLVFQANELKAKIPAALTTHPLVGEPMFASDKLENMAKDAAGECFLPHVYMGSVAMAIYGNNPSTAIGCAAACGTVAACASISTPANPTCYGTGTACALCYGSGAATVSGRCMRFFQSFF